MNEKKDKDECSVASHGSLQPGSKEVASREPFYQHGNLVGETVIFTDGEIRVYADPLPDSNSDCRS